MFLSLSIIVLITYIIKTLKWNNNPVMYNVYIEKNIRRITNKPPQNLKEYYVVGLNKMITNEVDKRL